MILWNFRKINLKRTNIHKDQYNKKYLKKEKAFLVIKNNLMKAQDINMFHQIISMNIKI